MAAVFITARFEPFEQLLPGLYQAFCAFLCACHRIQSTFKILEFYFVIFFFALVYSDPDFIPVLGIVFCSQRVVETEVSPVFRWFV